MIESMFRDDWEAEADVLEGVELPLKNLEYTIEQYLLAHGARLDTETRFLLAGVRDCVSRVAGSRRRSSEAEDEEEACCGMRPQACSSRSSSSSA